MSIETGQCFVFVPSFHVDLVAFKGLFSICFLLRAQTNDDDDNNDNNYRSD